MAPKRKEPDPASAAPQRRAEAPLFAGCRMVFWAGSSTKVMQRRVQELGGVVQPAVTADATTHVVCPAAPPMTTKHVLTKLQGYQGPSVTVRVVDGTELSLPAGVTFVLPDWVARSIGKQARQPAEPYLPPCLRPAPPPTPALPDTQGSQEVEAGGRAGAVDTDDAAGGGGQTLQEEEEPASSVVTVALTEQELAAAQEGVVDQPPAAAAAAAEATGAAGWGSPGKQQHAQQQQEAAGEQFDRQQPVAAQQQQKQQQQRAVGTRVRCQVARRGAEFVAVEGVKPQYTGGLTGIPWGSFGVWDEPWDPAAARDTRDKLGRYWYNKGGDGTRASSPPTSPQAPARTNGVCAHVCCSRRPYCLVAKLEQFKSVYMEAKGTDQFRMKAIDRATQELARWAEPLHTEEDVERMGLAKKSAEKVKEILLTGTSSRVEAAAADERRKVLNLLLEVWGVGPIVAQRWYDRGIRSLEDVRERASELSLSEQQRTYLMYVDDLSQRIPRAEITRAEAIVREACFDLVERKGARDCERTYCQATGSYRRGKADSGDIDFLMCLPPSLQGVSTHAFLSELLGLLLDRDFLLDEMSPRAPPPDPHAPGSLDERASWMGLCRVGGGPVRRVDVKVYTHPAAPFAVNYFANSQDFCRATRHWANHAVPERAWRYNPVATGFKISDIDMLPIVRHGRAARRGGGGGGGGAHGSESEGEEQQQQQQQHEQLTGAAGRDSQWARSSGVTVLGPAVPCADETALFRELGLAFVPVRMRVFPQGAAPL